MSYRCAASPNLTSFVISVSPMFSHFTEACSCSQEHVVTSTSADIKEPVQKGRCPRDHVKNLSLGGLTLSQVPSLVNLNQTPMAGTIVVVCAGGNDCFPRNRLAPHYESLQAAVYTAKDFLMSQGASMVLFLGIPLASPWAATRW